MYDPKVHGPLRERFAIAHGDGEWAGFTHKGVMVQLPEDNYQVVNTKAYSAAVAECQPKPTNRRYV